MSAWPGRKVNQICISHLLRASRSSKCKSPCMRITTCLEKRREEKRPRERERVQPPTHYERRILCMRRETSWIFRVFEEEKKWARRRNTYRFVSQLFGSIGFASELDHPGSETTKPVAGIETLSNVKHCFECPSSIVIDRTVHFIRIQPRLSHSHTLLVRAREDERSPLDLWPSRLHSLLLSENGVEIDEDVFSIDKAQLVCRENSRTERSRTDTPQGDWRQEEARGALVATSFVYLRHCYWWNQWKSTWNSLSDRDWWSCGYPSEFDSWQRYVQWVEEELDTRAKALGCLRRETSRTTICSIEIVSPAINLEENVLWHWLFRGRLAISGKWLFSAGGWRDSSLPTDVFLME